VSLGTEVNVLPAAVEQATARGGLVVAQMNPRMPYTFGDGELDEEMIDVAVEVDDPLPVHVGRPADEPSLLIGGRVAALVPDGATPAERYRRCPGRGPCRSARSPRSSGLERDVQRGVDTR
jgi:hypothetical protein